MPRTPLLNRFAGILVMVLLVAVALALRLPPPASAHADSKAEGAELFATRGCTHCHGATGQGTDDGPSLRGLRRRLKPDQITHQIVAGGKAMPAFGDTLDHQQVESLVSFLRAKTWIPAPVPAPAPAKSEP